MPRHFETVEPRPILEPKRPFAIVRCKPDVKPITAEGAIEEGRLPWLCPWSIFNFRKEPTLLVQEGLWWKKSRCTKRISSRNDYSKTLYQGDEIHSSDAAGFRVRGTERGELTVDARLVAGVLETILYRSTYLRADRAVRCNMIDAGFEGEPGICLRGWMGPYMHIGGGGMVLSVKW